jgi:Leucine-rich repeat (LRR) protein
MLPQVDPLSRLERLQLQGNRLEELPEQFEYLTALTFVDLTGNSLHTNADVC